MITAAKIRLFPEQSTFFLQKLCIVSQGHKVLTLTTEAQGYRVLSFTTEAQGHGAFHSAEKNSVPRW